LAKRSSIEDEERELIIALYPGLRRIAAVAGDVDIEPDDLVQEALVRTMSKRNLTELDNPLAYLRAAIVNLASNQRRSLARRRGAVARLFSTDSWVPSYPSEIDAILDLPPRQKALLYLVEVEGVPYDEAAGQLGLSVKAARTMASRARKKARLNLEATSG